MVSILPGLCVSILVVTDLVFLSLLSRFELAMQLKDLRATYEIAKKLEVSHCINVINIVVTAHAHTYYTHHKQCLHGNTMQSDSKWKMLADLAIVKCQFGLAMECLNHARDFGGLLLLATSAGDAGTLDKLAELSTGDGQHNIAFMAHFLMGRLEEALEVLVATGRLPEAAFFARTYLPSQVSR